jgi:hypothetical protein
VHEHQCRTSLVAGASAGLALVLDVASKIGQDWQPVVFGKWMKDRIEYLLADQDKGIPRAKRNLAVGRLAAIVSMSSSIALATNDGSNYNYSLVKAKLARVKRETPSTEGVSLVCRGAEI